MTMTWIVIAMSVVVALLYVKKRRRWIGRVSIRRRRTSHCLVAGRLSDDSRKDPPLHPPLVARVRGIAEEDTPHKRSCRAGLRPPRRARRHSIRSRWPQLGSDGRLFGLERVEQVHDRTPDPERPIVPLSSWWAARHQAQDVS